MNLLRQLAKIAYRRQTRWALEKDRIMETFITKNILEGGSDEFINKQRQILLGIQGEIRAKETLLSFLKQLK